MSPKPVFVVLCVALLFAACGSSSDRVEPVLTAADRVGPGALTAPELIVVADLDPSDELYRMIENPAVFVRVRDGAAPFIFTTDCADLFAYELPAGWEATCTRRVTGSGATEEGVFLYRTIP